jgi:hypothetical protein
MALLTRRRVILAKIETTYGTDSTPTGAANAILVRDLTITPLNAELIQRDLIRPYLGASPQLLAATSATVEFSVEMAGAGAAGTAPAYGPLLRACGMSENPVGTPTATAVEYKPVSTAFPSVTIYFNVDGVQHKLTGARGNVALSINAKEIPVYQFTFTGLYKPAADATLPTPDYTAFQAPQAANTSNTPTFSFFSHSAPLQNLEINFNNEVIFRSLIGAESVIITNRNVSGTALFEAPKITTKDFFSAAVDSVTGALQLIHGTAAGKIVQLDSSVVSIGNPTYQDSDGIHMLSVPFNLVPTTSGNDEITITVK